MDGHNSWEGKVEVFVAGRGWKAVGGYLWDTRGANFVCQQLGLSNSKS